MTIQFLRYWNGYEVDSRVDLDSEEENRLVSIGLARQWSPAIDGRSASGGVRIITAQQALAPTPDLLADTSVTYEHETTGARYYSDRTQLIQFGGVVGSAVSLDANGEPQLNMPGGRAPFKLTPLAGTPVAPKVAGVWQQVALIDAGSDVAHAEILITANCTTGTDPESPSTALMSQRFAAPDDNGEVWITGITGAFATGALPTVEVAGGLRLLHIALRGGSTYTQAAGNVVTASEAVLMTFDEEDGVNAFDVAIAPPTGTNGRYRQLAVRGFKAAV